MKVRIVLYISLVLVFGLISVGGASAADGLIWANRAGGAHADFGYAATTLSDDSVVVTGFFRESATFGPDETNETLLASPGDGGRRRFHRAL